MAGTGPADAATWSNWAGNQHSRATAVLRPSSVAEVAEQVRAAAEAGERIRPVGSGHSFTPVAVGDGRRMDLARLAIDVRVDIDRRLVTVPAGMTLRELNALLAGHQLALPNLGDIDAQTVAGAISTGTHGTGAAHGGLATFVEALTLVTGAGEVLRCSADERPDVFDAARISLGALGVLVEVTLRCVDAFVLRAQERPASLDSVLAEIPALVDAHDHVEFFWFPYTTRVQLKTNDRVAVDDRPLSRWRSWRDDDFLANTVFAGACRLSRAMPNLAPGISALSARALTERIYTGRSDAVFCSPRRVRFLEMEYALPRETLADALDALRRIIDGLPFKVLFPVEVRFTAADRIPLSHSYGRESAYLAVHQYVGMPYEPYFRAFEKVATALGGRPHWGKLHWRDAESLAPAYPRWHDFQQIRARLDPHHTFTTPHLTTLLG
ncbi:L-gulonolactone oxidase [Micromonospora phaseoli]|uniref:L-gulonolactone oxidase n=1 Tax=Micromonospora phaseoli TaxID=1144548 RepID=A0A1H7ATY9_9ACTN|nr:D-arabinono-1,4-lactone oxidase [Micromonospora phaseoli]PZV96341.1 L-gulonolactone oxidase [Micromonospora phaseoli]GIJ76028.1 L-gulonolactone oxidase [Micromonospora phaseoli]SEJ65562.1 L-gulonolactone oxidase [Micromonospora phaseoli]